MSDRPYLIGVAGPSGSGKTELSRKLADILSAPVVTLDSYYRELSHLSLEERTRINFDEPHALDRDLLAEQLSELAQGKAISVPVYDFALHTRAPGVERMEPGAFVIVEGLFALYWEDVRELLGTRVYVFTGADLCFARRLNRDMRERGRTPESVREQYEATVRPMAEQYIHPTRSFADIVVSGTDRLERSAAAVMAHVQMVSSKPSDCRLRQATGYHLSM